MQDCLKDTWKKGNNCDIEVDFILQLPEKEIKIPVKCKASLKPYKRHYKNIPHYLELTQRFQEIVILAYILLSSKMTT
jgi:hypothetical protein